MSHQPLIIIAFDAGDPGLLRQWAGNGSLPNIAKIMEDGFWGGTTGPDLINEHGAFVSLFSGVSCAEHGYHYSRQLRPGTYDLHTTTPLTADTQPFWSRLAGSSRRVAILDAPDVRPVPGLAGVQIADWATHNPRLDPAVEPASALDEVREFFGPRRVIVEAPGASPDEDRRLLAAMLDRVERKGALCRHFLERADFDLFVAGFPDPHPAAHQFWPYFTEQRSAGEDLRKALHDVYRAVDREIGLLLDEAPAEANRFVVSSVGIQEQYPIYHLMEDFCRKLEYQFSPPPGQASWTPMTAIRRFVPESLRVGVSRHFSRARRERLLADQFRARTDWTRTRAFAIPSSFTGLLRVNLRGREPEGTVEPGAEYRDVLDQLATDLRAIVDPVTGKPAVEDAFITVDRFGGDPPESLPDMFVVWKPARHFMARLHHPRAELSQEIPEFSRDTHHSQSGFVCGAGPGVDRRGDQGDIPVLDLAPAWAAMLDA